MPLSGMAAYRCTLMPHSGMTVRLRAVVRRRPSRGVSPIICCPSRARCRLTLIAALVGERLVAGSQRLDHDRGPDQNGA